MTLEAAKELLGRDPTESESAALVEAKMAQDGRPLWAVLRSAAWQKVKNSN